MKFKSIALLWGLFYILTRTCMKLLDYKMHVQDGSFYVQASFEFLSTPNLLLVLMFSYYLLNLVVVNVF